MRFSILAMFTAPILVSAQYGYASVPPPLPSATPGQHFVEVGPGNTFTFVPNSIIAKVNETVTFFFQQPQGFQHSITQSDFADPCTLLDGGFDSDLQDSGKQFTITITDDSHPIWFYCKQTKPLNHCGATGMVGGINAPVGSGQTVDDFILAAKDVGNNEGPQTASGGLSGVGAVATGPASFP